MIYQAENERFRIAVDTKGAQLQSIYDKTSDTEYLWQGDPAVWSGRSPILFPIVGRVKDDRYVYQGKTYSLPKHGFARHSEFTLRENAGDRLVFVLHENKETLGAFPFRFSLTVTFLLRGDALLVTHEVINAGDTDLYYSIGAHPGFCCAMGDKLVFDEPETLYTQMIDLESCLRKPERQLILNNAREIEITPDVFLRDALIFDGVHSKGVTLKKADGRHVYFVFGDAPYLGIWAKPGAPYVCLEPWYGVNDPEGGSLSLPLKEGINCLAPGKRSSFYWQASFPIPT